jgi:hypothetical protein
VTVGAVFFDVGETLVDEERWWRHVANAAGVGPHVVWAALGKTIERGEEHWELWHHLGVERPADAWSAVVYSLDDLYPDALSCLEELRAAGYLVGIAGNQHAALEAGARRSCPSTSSPARRASVAASPTPRSSRVSPRSPGWRRTRSRTSATGWTTTSVRLLRPGWRPST